MNARIISMAAWALVGLCSLPRSLSAAPDCTHQAVRHHQSIPVRELGEWQPIGDQAVLIWIPNSARAHLLQLTAPLKGLQDATDLTVIGGPGLQPIVACGHDAVVIDGDPATRTSIASIEVLSALRAAQLARPARPPQWT